MLESRDVPFKDVQKRTRKKGQNGHLVEAKTRLCEKNIKSRSPGGFLLLILFRKIHRDSRDSKKAFLEKMSCAHAGNVLTLQGARFRDMPLVVGCLASHHKASRVGPPLGVLWWQTWPWPCLCAWPWKWPCGPWLWPWPWPRPGHGQPWPWPWPWPWGPPLPRPWPWPWLGHAYAHRSLLCHCHVASAMAFGHGLSPRAPFVSSALPCPGLCPCSCPCLCALFGVLLCLCLGICSWPWMLPSFPEHGPDICPSTCALVGMVRWPSWSRLGV